MLLATGLLLASKAAAPKTTSWFCGYCWSWLAPVLPYAGQAGSLAAGGFAITKHIDQSEAREVQMTLETKRYNTALAKLKSMELTTGEKLRIDDMNQEKETSERSLKGHSMLVSTKCRFAAHMSAMSQTTADLADMFLVASMRMIDSHVRSLNRTEDPTAYTCENHQEDWDLCTACTYQEDWNPCTCTACTYENHMGDPTCENIANILRIMSMKSIQKHVHAFEITLRL